MGTRRRASLTVDVHAFESAIGPSFMQLRRDARGYARERVYRIADIMRLIAPRLKRPDPRFYPGELADSIEVLEMGPDTWEIAVWVRWAGFLEFGTHKMLAQPYFRPAIAMVEAESI